MIRDAMDSGWTGYRIGTEQSVSKEAGAQEIRLPAQKLAGLVYKAKWSRLRTN